ncbi:c-type cytochrome [Aquipluma nitroreducens]|uniref:c-type cytochrome n=1 Tax=Aquipluma nitroreducens TaxID=2010828 RepID=UPI00296E4744|nr:c-type cytochrome [Aquipluma nitroreducens]
MKKEIFLATGLVLSICVSGSTPEKEPGRNTEHETVLETKTSINLTENFQTPAKVVSPGEKLFKDKGCTVCHQLNTKLVGPPLKTIATAYTNNKKGLVAFLKDSGKPIVDPSQASVMHPQIAITKALPANELDAIVDYILSIK